MNSKVKSAIKEYQCPGCVNGPGLRCYKEADQPGDQCGGHVPGTILSNVGLIYLGMPKGFNRLGRSVDMKPCIFETFEKGDWDFGKWNIPVWKHLNKSGHTLVRGISPRTNLTFLHVYLEDCRDKIDCLEITQEDVEFMD